MFDLNALKRQVKEWVGSSLQDTPDDEVMEGALPPTLSRMAQCMEHHRFSDLLNYESYDEETSLFFNSASHGFAFECAPLVGASEETVRVLLGLFKQSLPTGATIQTMLYASPQVLPVMKEWAKMRLPDQEYSPEELDRLGRTPRSTNVYRRMARRRLDYLLKGRWNSLFEGQEYRLRNFRLFITVSLPGNDPTETEIKHAISARDGFEGTLRTAGIQSRQMKPRDLITLLHEILNPNATEHVREARQYDEGALIRDQVIDRDTVYRVGAQGMTINDTAVRSYTVQGYPQEMLLPYMTGLIGDEFQETMQVPAPFLLCCNIRIPDREALRSKVQMKTARAVQSADSQMARIMPDMGAKAEEWKYISDAVEKGVDLVEVSHSVIMLSRPETANAAENKLLSMWRSKGWTLSRDSFLQVQGFLASLPFGYDSQMAADFASMKRTRKMTEWNAANMMPLMAEWGGTGTPRMMLMGRRGQPLSFDVFDVSQAGNMNAAIVASSGSGKSFFLNEMATAYVGTGGRVWIIDVGRSYQRTCELLGGQFIEFGEKSKINVNPFTFIDTLDKDRIRLLKDIVSQAISSQRELTDLEGSWVEQAINYAWAEKGNQATLTDVAHHLIHVNPDARAHDLGDMLYPYTKDGMYADYFEGPANLNFNSSLVVLELEELKGRKDLQAVILLIIMLQIQEAMYLSHQSGNREQPKICIIDEAWDLMSGGKAADFIETGYRRARKYGGSFMTATQGVNDYFKNDASRAAWENADWMFLLRQKEESIDDLKNSGRFKVEGYTERLLRSVKTQQGQYSEIFVKSPLGSGIGRLIADPFSEFMYSTKADEVAAINQLQENGVALADAIEIVIEQRKGKKE